MSSSSISLVFAVTIKSSAQRTKLTFDLDLAKKKSSKNPVYYVQYAYARISSILRKAKTKPSKDFKLLKEDAKEIMKFMEESEERAQQKF